MVFLVKYFSVAINYVLEPVENSLEFQVEEILYFQPVSSYESGRSFYGSSLIVYMQN